MLKIFIQQFKCKAFFFFCDVQYVHIFRNIFVGTCWTNPFVLDLFENVNH